MFINNFDPVAFEIFSLEIRWYSLSYIFGLVFGWYFAKSKLIKDSAQKEYFDDYQFGEDFILTYSFYNTINLILKSYGIDKTYDGELPPKCYEQIFDFIIENIEDCVIELDE